MRVRRDGETAWTGFQERARIPGSWAGNPTPEETRLGRLPHCWERSGDVLVGKLVSPRRSRCSPISVEARESHDCARDSVSRALPADDDSTPRSVRHGSMPHPRMTPITRRPSYTRRLPWPCAAEQPYTVPS
jgi:hypothetical protein